MEEVKGLLKSIFFIFWRTVNLPRLYLNRVKFASDIELSGMLWVRNHGSIEIGRNVRINSSASSNPIGGGDRTFFQVLEGGSLFIGEGVKMSNVAVTASKSVEIGSDVFLGAGVAIYDTDFHPVNFNARVLGRTGQIETRRGAIAIGRGCFVGTRAIILKGVSIGDYAIVGAGSVVTSDIPTREIWAGNPARKVGEL